MYELNSQNNSRNRSLLNVECKENDVAIRRVSIDGLGLTVIVQLRTVVTAVASHPNSQSLWRIGT